MSFETDGFEVARGIASQEAIAAIRRGIFEIMRPHCDLDPSDPNAIDKGFLALGRLSPALKSNCYRLFGKLAAVPRILSEPGVARKIKEFGFEDATIQAYSVFCLEPGNQRNTFLPHQDLRDRTSLNSLQLWIPLSTGSNLGGVACFANTHRKGPLHHDITANGKPFLNESEFAQARRYDMVDYALGDIVFMTPYLVHESIENTGNSVRWTAVIKMDSVRDLKHLSESVTPFPIDQYIDLRTNEQRLKPA